MAEMPGIVRPERQALPQLRDREGSRVRTACLYGLAFAVITALGCTPGLGFVHVNFSPPTRG